MMKLTGAVVKYVRVLAALLAVLLAALLAAGLFTGCPPVDGPNNDETTVSSHGGPLILAHWMPWYIGPRFQREMDSPAAFGLPGGSGHWRGWSRYEPWLTDEQGRARIAARQYPLTGPYHSANPALLDFQASLMIIAGIDGVIIDWYGAYVANDFGFNHDNTVALVETLRRAGLNFLIMYEDNTLNMMGMQNVTPRSLDIGKYSINWAAANWFNDPLYVRFQGRPVLLCFGPQHFNRQDHWDFLFSDVHPRPWFGDIDNRFHWSDATFNWPPMHLSYRNDGILTEAELTGYLQRFYARNAASPFRIATVFSAFHDSYAQSFGYLSYNDGQTFRLTWDMAMDFEPHVIQIATWNDFGEGTIIEPTMERGYNELEFIQNKVREWNPDFPFTREDLRWPLEFYRLRFTETATAEEEAAIQAATAALFRRDAEAFRAAAHSVRAGLAVDVNDLRPILRVP